MLQFTAIDIVGDELELLQLAGNILHSRLFDDKDQKKFMVQVQVTGQPSRMPVARDQMIGKSGLTSKPPAEFSIVLSLSAGLAQALDMFAHELIHISQLRSGRLKIHAKTKKIDGVKQRVYFAKWGKAKPVMIDALPYAERGWEQEAYQWQTHLRTDAIALMLGAPHQLHVQSAKGELALFDAKGPLASAPAAPTTSAQPQATPQVPFTPAPILPSAAQQQIAMPQTIGSVPPQPAVTPPTQPAMPMMQQPVPQAGQPMQQAGDMMPQYGAVPQAQPVAPAMPQIPQNSPAMQPSTGAPNSQMPPLTNMQNQQQPAYPANIDPAAQAAVAPAIQPVMARAVARPVAPAASEMPAMPNVPAPTEPTSFKPMEDFAAAADRQMAPEAMTVSNSDETDELAIEEIQPEIAAPEFPGAIDNLSVPIEDTSLPDDMELTSEVDLLSSDDALNSEEDSEVADDLDPDDNLGAMDGLGADDEVNSDMVDESEPITPAVPLPEAALDDDVLAALMADDASGPSFEVADEAGEPNEALDRADRYNELADEVGLEDETSASAGQLDATESDLEEASSEMRAPMESDFGADDASAVVSDFNDSSDSAISSELAEASPTESDMLSDSSSTKTGAPKSALSENVPEDAISPKTAPVISPKTSDSSFDVPPPKYDAFGSAPDLTALNAVATDADKAFNQPRFVDVDGVGEARQLNEGAVDSKLKDLQARGLADVDSSRAKRSEELS